MHNVNTQQRLSSFQSLAGPLPATPSYDDADMDTGRPSHIDMLSGVRSWSVSPRVLRDDLLLPAESVFRESGTIAHFARRRIAERHRCRPGMRTCRLTANRRGAAAWNETLDHAPRSQSLLHGVLSIIALSVRQPRLCLHLPRILCASIAQVGAPALPAPIASGSAACAALRCNIVSRLGFRTHFVEGSVVLGVHVARLLCPLTPATGPLMTLPHTRTHARAARRSGAGR